MNRFLLILILLVCLPSSINAEEPCATPEVKQPGFHPNYMQAASAVVLYKVLNGLGGEYDAALEKRGRSYWGSRREPDPYTKWADIAKESGLVADPDSPWAWRRGCVYATAVETYFSIRKENRHRCALPPAMG